MPTDAVDALLSTTTESLGPTLTLTDDANALVANCGKLTGNVTALPLSA